MFQCAMLALQGYYFTGDGCKRDKDGYYWITGQALHSVLILLDLLWSQGLQCVTDLQFVLCCIDQVACHD